MNQLLDCELHQDGLFMGFSHPAVDEGEISSIPTIGWTVVGDKIRFQQCSADYEREINLGQGRLIGTTFNDVMRLDPPTGLQFNSEINRLKSLYKFRNPSQAERVLDGNSSLVEMVSSIYTKIRKEFPSENILLEVLSDYPSSSENDLVISVSTSLPVDEAIDRLDKVENVRWNKSSPDPYVNVCVKLDYL